MQVILHKITCLFIDCSHTSDKQYYTMSIVEITPVRMILLDSIDSFKIDSSSKDILKKTIKEKDIKIQELYKKASPVLSEGYINKILYSSKTMAVKADKLLFLLDLLDLKPEDLFQTSITYLQ